MQYYVEETDTTYYDIDIVIGACIEDDYHEDDDYFEEWVNDSYDSVEIGGKTYYPYDIINEFSDGIYHDVLEEYCETCNEDDWSNARYELEHARVGDEVNIQAYTVHVMEDDERDADVDDEMPFAVEEAISAVRERLTLNKQTEVEQILQTKEDENKLMEMLQIVGD